MEKEMLGYLFRYEDDKLYRKLKKGNKWSCCNDLIPYNNGYMIVRVNNKGMLLHRLVYLFHNPDWNIYGRAGCDNQIDHINGNKLDNKIENLRVTTHSQNLQNRTHFNGEPIKGVYFNKKDRWQAYWHENGKQRGKSFNTEEEALAHRREMVDLHYTHDPAKRN